MRTINVARFLLALMLFQVAHVALAASFDDTDGNRYEDEIEELADEDIVEGVGNDRFEPNRTINRAEFAMILVRALFDEDDMDDCLDDNNSPFLDVNGYEWYAGAVCVAEDEGIVHGYPDGNFRPNWEITYAEAAVMVTRALDVDVDNGYEWFSGAIEAIEDNDADPPTVGYEHSYITRGEMAYMLVNMDILDEVDNDNDDDDCDDDEDWDDCDDDDDDDDNDDQDCDEVDCEDETGDVTLRVELDDDSIEAGDTVEYTIEVENESDDDIEIDVSAELDDLMEVLDISDDGDEDGDQVEWNNLEINEGDSIELTMEVEIDEDADDGDEFELVVEAEDARVTIRGEVDEDSDDDDDDDDDDLDLESYYSYSSTEVDNLDNLSGDREDVRPGDMYDWDRIAMDIVKLRNFPPTVASLFYASLAVAQRDAIVVGERSRGDSRNSIDWVSAEVICRFSNPDCAQARQSQVNDSYAQGISNLIMQRIDARIQANASAPIPTTLTGAIYWNGTAPTTPNAGNWQPWIVSQTFVPAPPTFGSVQDTSEIDAVRQIVLNTTSARREAVLRWAGGAGTETAAGLWLNIVNDLQRDEDADTEEVARVRSLAMMAAADAFTAAWRAKFTYATKRPNMRDTSIVTVIPTPNSPSFYSADAAVASAVSKVLADFYEDDEDELDDQAVEAANSRFWAGINFRNDTTVGMDIGEDIADSVLDWEDDR